MGLATANIIKWLKLGFVFVVIIAGLWLVWSYTNLFMPFIVALILTYFLNPVVDWLEGRGLNRSSAVVFMYIAFVLAGFMFFILFFPSLKEQAVNFRDNVPVYIDRLKILVLNLINDISSKVPGLHLEKLSGHLEESVDSIGPMLASQAPSLVTSSLSFLGMMLLVPIILFSFLQDGRNIKKTLIAMVPNRYFEMVLTLLYEINLQISNYINGRIIETIWVIALTVIGYYIIGLKYIILMSVIAGILNIIPYLGPILGAIPAVIIAMAGTNSTPMIIGIAIVTVAVQILDNVLIVPLAVGKSVNMHPLVVLLALLAGAQFMGVWGMVLSIPLLGSLMVTFKVLYRHFIEYRL
jgi:predicted PurR-regulated permease PerM